MNWTDHSDAEFTLEGATAEETLRWALALTDPREADAAVEVLDRHRSAIERLLSGRGRWAVLKSETLRGWLFGPLGFVGPAGLLAVGVAVGVALILDIAFPAFVVWTLGAFMALRLVVVKPDHRDWIAEGTTLGAGVVSAWAIRCQGERSRPGWDEHLRDALIAVPEYWHDLACLGVRALPLARRENLVLEAFSARSDDLWHLLPLVPTEAVVRAALSRGPRSSATTDFHAFQTLIQKADVGPVLSAIRAGAGNREVLIRAVAASGNPAAVDLLVATLAERNERLRSIARDGLVLMGPVVLPHLFEAIEIDNPRLQEGVARVLRGMGPNAEIEQFSAAMLGSDAVAPQAASELRRVVLTRRSIAAKLRYVRGEEQHIEEILSSIPAPSSSVGLLNWHDGTQLSLAATDLLVDLAASESPDHRCAELAALRPLLQAVSRDRLRVHTAESSEQPAYSMVLADDAELLQHHLEAARNRQSAEEWVDVLERHASLASVHALDDLWRTGVDGVVQTSAMAALMRTSGKYDGLEFFADQVLREVLANSDHPLYPNFSRGQFSRFEQMMITARRVTPAMFEAVFHTVPAQHVLWGTYDSHGELSGAFRLDEEYAAVDGSDDPFTFEPRVTIGVVHPAELGNRSSAMWAQVFSDYELVPHFEQLQRTACRLDGVQSTQMLYADFGDRAPGGPLEAALIRRGWRPSPIDIETVFTLTKPVQRGRSAFTAVVELDPGLGEDPEVLQAIECLAFTSGHHHVLSPVVTKVRLGDVDPVIFSEIVLELRDVLTSAASGEEHSLPAILARTD